MNKSAREYIRRFKYNSFYFKLFISFVSFVVLPTAFVGFFIYQKTSSNFQQQIVSYNLNSLNYMKDELGNDIQNLSATALQYSMLSNIKYFEHEKFESDRMVLKTLFDDINNSILTNNLIDSIYIFYKNSDQLLTNNGIYSFKDFYDQEWYDTASSRAKKNILLPTRKVVEKMGGTKSEKFVISMVSFFPLFDKSDTRAIVINISVKALQDKLSKMHGKSESMIYVIDDSENILFSEKGRYQEQKLESILGKKVSLQEGSGYLLGKYSDVKVIVSYTQPSYYGWRFIKLTPLEQITKNIKFIKNLIFGIVIITIFIGLLVVYQIANRLYAPIIYLMDTLQNGKYCDFRSIGPRKVKNEIDVLKWYVEDVSLRIQEEQQKNLLLKTQISQTKNILVKNLIQDLILNANVDKKAIFERLDALVWPQGRYVLLVIAIDNFSSFQKNWDKKDQSLWKFCVTNVAEEIISKKYSGILFEYLLNEWIAVIHISEPENADIQKDLKDTCNQIREAINQYLNAFTVSIGIGSICEDITSISKSYHNALKALQNRWFKGKNATHSFYDIKESNSPFYYSVDQEKQIISALKNGEFQRAKDAFQDFKNTLIIKNDYGYSNISQGIQHLIITIVKVLHEMGYSIDAIIGTDNENTEHNILHEFRQLETLSDVENWINNMFCSIINALREKRSNKNEANIRKVVEYINENYHHDICLTDLAQKFHMNEYYLSKAFKQEIGENFLEYLHRVRIEKSKSILKCSDASVCKASQMVGYQNVQTFIRIFKKLEGITPGQYKEDMRILQSMDQT